MPYPNSAAGIYRVVHIESDTAYIGSAVIFRKRWNLHRKNLRQHKHHSHYLQNAWDKYGADAFRWEILEIVSDKAELEAREQFYLDERYTRKGSHEYNMSPTAFSLAGMKKRPEVVEKTAIQLRGRKRPPHIGEAVSKAQRGVKESAETRAKLSAAHKGIHTTPESVAKAVATKRRKGITEKSRAASRANLKKRVPKPLTPEHKAKLSARLKGRQFTPEAIANMRAAQQKRFAAQRKLSRYVQGRLFD